MMSLSKRFGYISNSIQSSVESNKEMIAQMKKRISSLAHNRKPCNPSKILTEEEHEMDMLTCNDSQVIIQTKDTVSEETHAFHGKLTPTGLTSQEDNANQVMVHSVPQTELKCQNDVIRHKNTLHSQNTIENTSEAKSGLTGIRDNVQLKMSVNEDILTFSHASDQDSCKPMSSDHRDLTGKYQEPFRFNKLETKFYVKDPFEHRSPLCYGEWKKKQLSKQSSWSCQNIQNSEGNESIAHSKTGPYWTFKGDSRRYNQDQNNDRSDKSQMSGFKRSFSGTNRGSFNDRTSLVNHQDDNCTGNQQSTQTKSALSTSIKEAYWDDSSDSEQHACVKKSNEVPREQNEANCELQISKNHITNVAVSGDCWDCPVSEPGNQNDISMKNTNRPMYGHFHNKNRNSDQVVSNIKEDYWDDSEPENKNCEKNDSESLANTISSPHDKFGRNDFLPWNRSFGNKNKRCWDFSNSENKSPTGDSWSKTDQSQKDDWKSDSINQKYRPKHDRFRKDSWKNANQSEQSGWSSRGSRHQGRKFNRFSGQEKWKNDRSSNRSWTTKNTSYENQQISFPSSNVREEYWDCSDSEQKQRNDDSVWTMNASSQVKEDNCEKNSRCGYYEDSGKQKSQSSIKEEYWDCSDSEQKPGNTNTSGCDWKTSSMCQQDIKEQNSTFSFPSGVAVNTCADWDECSNNLPSECGSSILRNESWDSTDNFKVKNSPILVFENKSACNSNVESGQISSLHPLISNSKTCTGTENKDGILDADVQSPGVSYLKQETTLSEIQRNTYAENVVNGLQQMEKCMEIKNCQEDMELDSQSDDVGKIWINQDGKQSFRHSKDVVDYQNCFTTGDANNQKCTEGKPVAFGCALPQHSARKDPRIESTYIAKLKVEPSQNQGYQGKMTKMYTMINENDEQGLEKYKVSPLSSSGSQTHCLYVPPEGTMKFEGRTLLKGGVKPRHIPKNVLPKYKREKLCDPREKPNYGKRADIEIPMPPFFVEFVAYKYPKKKIATVSPLEKLVIPEVRNAEKNTEEDSCDACEIVPINACENNLPSNTVPFENKSLEQQVVSIMESFFNSLSQDGKTTVAKYIKKNIGDDQNCTYLPDANFCTYEHLSCRSGDAVETSTSICPVVKSQPDTSQRFCGKWEHGQLEDEQCEIRNRSQAWDQTDKSMVLYSTTTNSCQAAVTSQDQSSKSYPGHKRHRSNNSSQTYQKRPHVWDTYSTSSDDQHVGWQEKEICYSKKYMRGKDVLMEKKEIRRVKRRKDSQFQQPKHGSNNMPSRDRYRLDSSSSPLYED